MAKLLLIEDDGETAEEITAELTDCGFEVEWAADGIEGLDKARALRPDAMIVDRLLPGMDGLTVKGRPQSRPSSYSNRCKRALVRLFPASPCTKTIRVRAVRRRTWSARSAAPLLLI